MTPWAAYHRYHQERGGMRIPLAAEVEWQLPDRCLPYCKLNVVKVEYEFVHLGMKWIEDNIRIAQ